MMVGHNVDRIDGRHQYSAARPSRRNCFITIVTPAVYTRFLEFLYVDIQSTGRTLSRPWSRQPNDVMSEIKCAQLHSELFRRRHSTRQSHGLFALAKHLLTLIVRTLAVYDTVRENCMITILAGTVLYINRTQNWPTSVCDTVLWLPNFVMIGL